MPIDPLTIGQGLSAAAHVTNIVRGITGALKETGKSEAISQVIELQMLVSELIEKNRELTNKNYELESKLKMQGEMRFNGKWMDRAGDSEPLCPHCWEAEGKSIHLSPPYDNVNGGRSRHCRTCSREYDV